MRLKLIAAAIIGAAITAPACALAASTITTNLGLLTDTSGFNGIVPFGTDLNNSVNDSSLNTYVWTFQTSSAWDALFAMQAQNSEAIRFNSNSMSWLGGTGWKSPRPATWWAPSFPHRGPSRWRGAATGWKPMRSAFQRKISGPWTDR